MLHVIITSLILFGLKRFLMRTGFFSKELVNELRSQVKEQQEIIDYQNRKIIELQRMVLDAGYRA